MIKRLSRPQKPKGPVKPSEGELERQKLMQQLKELQQNKSNNQDLGSSPPNEGNKILKDSTKANLDSVNRPKSGVN